MPQKPQQELYPLHLLLPKLDPKVIDQLPAGNMPSQVAILLQK